MAQSWRVTPERHKKARPPLDGQALERIALLYVGRYATTRAKLRTFLSRKLRDRGWKEERRPPVDELVNRFTELGYVNDSAFASSRAMSLQRRGFGERRVDQALYAAGISDADAVEARDQVREGAFASALRFARRKRIGPYAQEEDDGEARRKAFAAMIRAGHPSDMVRRVLDIPPGEIDDCDMIE